MAEVKALLEGVHINSYRSLRDVELPLRPLTVIVGPNASGKSNIMKAFRLLKRMVTDQKLPTAKEIQDSLWTGESNHISLQLQAIIEETRTTYRLDFNAKADNLLAAETLSVNSVQVISIRNGEGTVQDEDRQNATTYRSNTLALTSAGDYGNKPITNIFVQFIKGWQLYDFRPDLIRKGLKRLPAAAKPVSRKTKAARDSLKRQNRQPLSHELWNWYNTDRDRFETVGESLQSSMNLRIDQREIDGDKQLCLLDGHTKPIPLTKASDGTLRLIAYYILLNKYELPPMIAIEEPERNLHPGALTDIANVLEQLSERTQVIITTHSSQLLDAFNPEDLSDSLGILLLRNRPGSGTEVINIEDIRGKRQALDGWISDFGIGSAIFDSELLQDVMED